MPISWRLDLALPNRSRHSCSTFLSALLALVNSPRQASELHCYFSYRLSTAVSCEMQAPAQVPFDKENELLSHADHSPISENCTRLPDDLLVQRGDLENYLTGQLSVRRLNAIHDRLWRAGLPGRVQPLHHQRVLRRNILVTERIDLHLVWYACPFH